MKKNYLLLGIMIIFSAILASCSGRAVVAVRESNPSGHTFEETSCTYTTQPTSCEVTEEKSLDYIFEGLSYIYSGHCKLFGHSWEDASCFTPKTCSVCSETEGTPGSHKYIEATCETPETCELCGKTNGRPLGHTRIENKPESICSRCGKLPCPDGHTWQEATCTTARICTVCKLTEGDPLEHDINNGRCSMCKVRMVDPDAMEEDTFYTLSDGIIDTLSIPDRQFGLNGCYYLSHQEYAQFPIIKDGSLIMKTYYSDFLLNDITFEKLNINETTYYSPSLFEISGSTLYCHTYDYGWQKVVDVTDLSGNSLFSNLPIKHSGSNTRHRCLFYGDSPYTAYDVYFWYGTEYKTIRIETNLIEFEISEEYQCNYTKTFDGYAVIDTSTLEPGYYRTDGYGLSSKTTGIIYID